MVTSRYIRLKTRPLFRISFASAFIVAVTSYTWCYFVIPQRYSMGGVRVSLVRRFAKDFQPYFFAPAGLVESIVVRIQHAVTSRPRCPEVVVLSTAHVSLRLPASADLPHVDAPLPPDADILQFTKEHPLWWIPPSFHPTMTNPDGTKVACNYWDCDVDRAEAFLKEKYRRPYTLRRVLGWYQQANDERTRAHLLTVLGASRDPRAGLVLADAIRSTNPDVPSAVAVKALSRHFGAGQCAVGGNLESDFEEARVWLDENEPRLRKEADNLPID